MSTRLLPVSPPIGAPPNELRNGDRLTQPEFHALYSGMPESFHAELIGGIVFVSSPLKRTHGRNHSPLGAVFLAYENATPGTESADNATVILGEDNEPQPDLLLRILPDFGGRSNTDADDYVTGPPELLAEVSASSRSIDLGLKRREYAEAGVLEYLVIDLRDHRLHWFDLVADRELTPDSDGVYRIKTFPALWIDPAALFDRDVRRLLATLDAGLATPEHAAFVARLAAARRPE